MSTIIKRNSFTITVDGDYLETIQTLLNALSYYKEDVINEGDRFNLCNLIASMLPNEEQILNEEDAELLKLAKQNRESFHMLKNENYG